MALSKSKLIADAVASKVERILTNNEIVVKSEAPNYTLERQTGSTVYCFTSERTSEIQSRSLQLVTYSVSIALIEKVSQPEEDLDGCLAVLEHIGDALITDQFDIETGTENLICDVIGYEHAPLYDRELLETRRLFGGGIIAQIQVAEALKRK
jgi:hypothetical protein